MHVKDLRAVLVEQEAAVAATRKWLRITVGLSSTAVLLLLFQNCAVDMSSNTPGAKAISLSCSASAQETTDFTAALTILQSTAKLASGQTACGSCHLSTSSNSGKNSFTVWSGTNADAVSLNLCNVRTKGSIVGTRPQQASHGGGQYPASDITALTTYLNTYAK